MFNTRPHLDCLARPSKRPGHLLMAFLPFQSFLVPLSVTTMKSNVKRILWVAGIVATVAVVGMHSRPTGRLLSADYLTRVSYSTTLLFCNIGAVVGVVAGTKKNISNSTTTTSTTSNAFTATGDGTAPTAIPSVTLDPALHKSFYGQAMLIPLSCYILNHIYRNGLHSYWCYYARLWREYYRCEKGHGASEPTYYPASSLWFRLVRINLGP